MNEIKQKSWDDVTIAMWVELNNVDTESPITKEIEEVAILTDTDSSELRSIPMSEFRKIQESVKFKHTPPKAEVTLKFDIDGKRYGMIPDLNFITAGEWIDVIRFRDWLKNTIQTNLATMMINRDKIPYTDPGIQVIVNNLRRSLQEGQNVGGIAPDEFDANGKTVFGFTISYPRSQDIPANIKATRVLTIGFQARLAGAIHQVTINGSLAYELQ